MSEIVPPSLVNAYFSDRRDSDLLSPKIEKKADSKIQEIVLSCLTKSSPTGLFVSAIAPDVVFIMELDRQGKMKKRRDWNKKRSQ